MSFSWSNASIRIKILPVWFEGGCCLCNIDKFTLPTRSFYCWLGENIHFIAANEWIWIFRYCIGTGYVILPRLLLIWRNKCQRIWPFVFDTINIINFSYAEEIQYINIKIKWKLGINLGSYISTKNLLSPVWKKFLFILFNVGVESCTLCACVKRFYWSPWF